MTVNVPPPHRVARTRPAPSPPTRARPVPAELDRYDAEPCTSCTAPATLLVLTWRGHVTGAACPKHTGDLRMPENAYLLRPGQSNAEGRTTT